MNLRAALLRHLTDLKKDGVLGGSVILRKTMLDECKGDKFEELLAVLSLIVLKKVLAAKGELHETPVVKASNLVPLILSHRKAIQRDLERRQELDLRTRQRQKNIEASIDALSEEAVAWKSRKAPMIPKNADLLKRLVHENWIGETEWVETILHGVPPTPGLAHDIMHEEEEDEASMPLTDLDARVRVQNKRLARWRDYLKTLQESRRPEQETAPSRITHLQPSTRFGRHQDITLSSITAEASPSAMKLNMRHTILLESLDDHRSSKVKSPSLAANQTHFRSKEFASEASRSVHRPTGLTKRLSSGSPIRRTSDTSSQDTQLAVTPRAERSQFSSSVRRQQDANPGLSNSQFDGLSHHGHDMSPSATMHEDQMSLADRTRASLAQFETPRSKLTRSKTTISSAIEEHDSTAKTRNLSSQHDGASLADRTRQSMSLLANVLDDNYHPRSNPRSNRPRHAKSKSMFVVSHRPKLERAWSEESLASAAKDDSFDVEADYESVFKSRPKLAMSPNLSPSRNSENLDADLEDALNKLTINSSSPDY